MDKTIYQSGRLYLWDDELDVYRWVVSPEVAVKVWGRDWEKQPRKYRREIEQYPQRCIGVPITDWPENDGNGHETDKLYKMLYVCPWYSKTTGFGGLDQIKEVGFNTYHTWSPLQWEQEGYWEGAGEADCLKQVERLLQEAYDRDMYACLQVPIGTSHLKHMALLMATFPNAIAGTVEEPDLSVPPSPTLKGQQRLYDIIKEVAPDLPVWGCFDGGVSPETFCSSAFDVLITDSYCYKRKNGPVPVTKAAETGYAGDPWWNISPWIRTNKFKQLHNSVPEDMPIINIQQGMWNTSEGHVLPRMEQEWNLYNEEFGLNSFALYPHGAEQGMGGVYVMTDNDARACGIKNQARTLMRKLDEREVR